MRKIVVSIQNCLLAEAISQMMLESGEFQPVRVAAAGTRKSDLAYQCRALEAELLIAEVAYTAGTTIDARLTEAKEIREVLPNCKIVLLCDENSAPELAREVMLAKRDGRIDGFFYSSVTAKYLLAALLSL